MHVHRRVPFIPQMQTVECGAAALAMVLAYHGHHAPLPEVRQACGVSRDGSSAGAILRAAHSYGLSAQGVALDMNGLKDLPLPAILHWSFRHFVVLERMRKGNAVVVDPAVGRRNVAVREVERRFTGVALVFTPGEEFKTRAATRPSLGRYKEVVWESLPTMAQLLGASLLLQIIGLVFPVSTQLLIDHVILPRQETWLWGLAIGLGTAAAGGALLSVLRNWVVQNFTYSIDLRLMHGFVDHVLHLPLSFFLHRTVGDLFQRLQSNSVISDLITSRTISAVLDSFLVVGFASLMLLYSPTLGGLVILLGIVRVVVLITLRARNRQLMSAELAASGRETSSLVEAFTTIEMTKAIGAQGHLMRRWADRMAEEANASVQRQSLEIFSAQIMVVLQGVGAAAVLWVGARAVLHEQMTVGMFAAFVSLQGLFMTPLGSLLGAVTNLQYLGSHLQRLDDVFESAIEHSGSIDLGPISGLIELEDVGFSYVPGGPSVVSGVSLTIRPGEKVALVGPSGAGKSTLARLLLGLHVPTKGRLRFDGIDLRDIDLPCLRRQIGVVLQETSFSNDTLRVNLSIYDPDLPLDRLRCAAAAACIDSVIEALPEKYETPMGPNGNRFSGGERQRLALARALTHEPAILLLDEATRALDLDTERRVHANLAARACTRIVITHRIATLQDADRIFVMRRGRVVQDGTFESLRSGCEVFRDLLESAERVHA